MLRQLVINRRLNSFRKKLKEVLLREEELSTRAEELVPAIDEAETDEELETIEAEIAEIEEQKAEIAEEKSRLEEEIEKLEAELEEIKSKEPANDKRKERADKMGDNELRTAIADFVRTKGRVRADEIEGFKVVDGGVLVPEEILPAQKEKREAIDLSEHVHIIPVTRGSGKFPLIKLSGRRMVSVAELEKNPELGKPQVEDVSYDIETYRGYVPVSQEVIDDADYDITGMIVEDIRDQDRNTKNHEIVEVWKAATPKTATGLDGLKEIVNVSLKRVYDVKLFVSASLFNELDTLKDARGRYLLQDDITSPSGKALFGKQIEILDDDFIGEQAGDMVAFIGDAYEFTKLFDRKQASAKWVDHNVYGELLASFVRFDVAEFDGNAGFYVTYEPVEQGN